MPILERAVIAASDDPTMDAIEAIRTALSDAVAADLAAEAEPVDDGEQEAAGETGPATPAQATPFRHGRIRLHSRP
jgi:hypothetical protein